MGVKKNDNRVLRNHIVYYCKHTNRYLGWEYIDEKAAEYCHSSTPIFPHSYSRLVWVYKLMKKGKKPTQS